jgi:hypothetical protein
VEASNWRQVTHCVILCMVRCSVLLTGVLQNLANGQLTLLSASAALQSSQAARGPAVAARVTHAVVFRHPTEP